MADEAKLLLIDRVFDLKDGRKLTMRFDLATDLERLRKYFDALRTVRGIPRDLTSISGKDQVLRYYVANMQKDAVKPVESALNRTVAFYENQTDIAQSDAAYLVIFIQKENEPLYIDPPRPYNTQAPEEDLLLGKEYVMERNLNEITEKRLKQIRDILEDNGLVGEVVSEISDLQAAVVRMMDRLIEVDEVSGFRPEPANA